MSICHGEEEIDFVLLHYDTTLPLASLYCAISVHVELRNNGSSLFISQEHLQLNQRIPKLLS